jgi:hypothetical protein
LSEFITPRTAIARQAERAAESVSEAYLQFLREKMCLARFTGFDVPRRRSTRR